MPCHMYRGTGADIYSHENRKKKTLLEGEKFSRFRFNIPAEYLQKNQSEKDIFVSSANVLLSHSFLLNEFTLHALKQNVMEKINYN